MRDVSRLVEVAVTAVHAMSDWLPGQRQRLDPSRWVVIVVPVLQDGAYAAMSDALGDEGEGERGWHGMGIRHTYGGTVREYKVRESVYRR